MKLLGKVFFGVFVIFASLNFFACKMPELPNLSCSGCVTFLESGLEGVAIKSNVKEYAVSNTSGNFSFETKSKGIVVYAEKEGYIFEPKQVTLNAGQNTVNFTAIKIENLHGNITLKNIIITPTSIVQSSDNYLYDNGGKVALKASDITIFTKANSYVLNQNYIYLNKNEQNVIDVKSNINFVCGEQFYMGIAVNTYFKNYNHEGKTTNAETTTLYVRNSQTNADLVNENQLIYNLYGINNKTKNFTINVSFVFEFVAD